jgi:hypothetical protein
MSQLFGAIISALVAYLIPKVLDPLFKRAEPASKMVEHRFSWGRWVLVHAIGGAAGGALSGALGVGRLNTPGGLGNWTAYGACLGIAQWFVLQREKAITPLWAVASTAGWSVWAFFEAAHAPAPLGWIFAGLAVGVLQWPILAKRRARAFWWMPANGVAWFIGGSIGVAAGLAMFKSGMSFASSWILGWSLVGVVGSCITGFVLARIPQKELVMNAKDFNIETQKH